MCVLCVGSISWLAWRHGFSATWIGPVTNSFVHVLMYSYYCLTDMKVISNYWGGLFITPVQLIQFVLCLGAVSWDLFHPECKPAWFAIIYA